MSELTDAELAGAVESYRRGLSIDQIANSSRFYGRITPEQLSALVVPALERLQENAVIEKRRTKKAGKRG